MSAKLLMLVGDYAEDYQVMVPFQAFWAIGYQVDAICPNKSTGDVIKTIIRNLASDQVYSEQSGHDFTLNADFNHINTSEYQGLIIPGGRAPEYLRLNPKVINIVREFDAAKKPIAAMCHGVQVLAAARVIHNRYIASFHTCAHDIHLVGGKYIEVPNDNAMADGHIITAPSWLAQPAWMAQLLMALGTKIEIP
ncbi:MULTISPECIES: DJ-1/PfpI family protein [Vitreoscilla]|uniref:DJ-1/PfpI family protein n=1 Tax=Vitreoscilla stercoraria TaxID=61 RepID=A0ABY4EB80_VITST|nr:MULTISPECIES: DJ-1/PfpI family protein [Vitreoscilla]AUZ05582.1 intracellular protease PfpI [Vitreoscilla sp. C1]UOO93001.1 DJ-1/PfpI family protein [Vitreoscilla stercoraria]